MFIPTLDWKNLKLKVYQIIIDYVSTHVDLEMLIETQTFFSLSFVKKNTSEHFSCNSVSAGY